MRGDGATGMDTAGVGVKAAGREGLRWSVKTTIAKFADDEAFARGEVCEVIEREGNLLLNEGIQELLDLLIAAGGSVTAYDNTNARIGVGTGTTAADATQTALQGGSTAFKAMDVSYPQRSGQTMSWRATFGSSEGNFAWEEWTIDNGSTRNKNLNRKVESLGTKASGTTWQITVSVTIS